MKLVYSNPDKRFSFKTVQATFLGCNLPTTFLCCSIVSTQHCTSCKKEVLHLKYAMISEILLQKSYPKFEKTHKWSPN